MSKYKESSKEECKPRRGTCSIGSQQRYALYALKAKKRSPSPRLARHKSERLVRLPNSHDRFPSARPMLLHGRLPQKLVSFSFTDKGGRIPAPRRGWTWLDGYGASERANERRRIPCPSSLFSFESRLSNLNTMGINVLGGDGMCACIRRKGELLFFRRVWQPTTSRPCHMKLASRAPNGKKSKNQGSQFATGSA